MGRRSRSEWLSRWPRVLDATGRMIRIVPAAEFRRIHGVPERPTILKLRRTRGRASAPSSRRDRERPVP